MKRDSSDRSSSRTTKMLVVTVSFLILVLVAVIILRFVPRPADIIADDNAPASSTESTPPEAPQNPKDPALDPGAIVESGDTSVIPSVPVQYNEYFDQPLPDDLTAFAESMGYTVMSDLNGAMISKDDMRIYIGDGYVRYPILSGLDVVAGTIANNPHYQMEAELVQRFPVVYHDLPCSVKPDDINSPTARYVISGIIRSLEAIAVGNRDQNAISNLSDIIPESLSAAAIQNGYEYYIFRSAGGDVGWGDYLVIKKMIPLTLPGRFETTGIILYKSFDDACSWYLFAHNGSLGYSTQEDLPTESFTLSDETDILSWQINQQQLDEIIVLLQTDGMVDIIGPVTGL